jgi:hypothetical protein
MTAPALGPASSSASGGGRHGTRDRRSRVPVMRLHPTACVADAGIERCPGGAGAGRARRPAGRAALPGCGRTRFWSPGRTPGGSGQHERVGAADGDEELPEASLRVLAAGALVRHRAGGGGFPGAEPPALTDDAVRAAARRSGDVPGVRRLPHRALPAAASTAGRQPSTPQPYGCSSRPTTRRLGQQRRHRRAKRSISPANAGPAGYRVRRTP